MKNQNDPSERTATILFVDLIGSSEVASIKGLKNYSEKYIQRFQKVVEESIEKVFNVKPAEEFRKNKSLKDDFQDFNIRGDECFLVMASKQQDLSEENRKEAIRRDIIKVFSLSLMIKYLWLFDTECSLKRLEAMKKPFDIAIGINTGKVKLEQASNKDYQIFNAEGYAINLAKRIESESRKGESSGIFVSEHTFGYYTDISGENILRFKRQERSSLKGISGDVRTYELIFANLDEEDEIVKIPENWIDKQWNETEENLRIIEKAFLDTWNPWLGNVVANIEWKKGSSILEEVDNLREKDESKHKEEIHKLKRKAEPLLGKAAEIARKLIEIDPYNPAWKIYLAQIVFDYTDYQLIDYKKESVDRYLERELLIKDTVKLLETLTSEQTHELDALLYLGRFHLEIDKIGKIIKGSGPEQAIEYFQRIIIWDDEYPDAYYYQSATRLKVKPGDKKIVYELLEKAITIARKLGDPERIKKHARKDKLFKSIRYEEDFLKLTRANNNIDK